MAEGVRQMFVTFIDRNNMLMVGLISGSPMCQVSRQVSDPLKASDTNSNTAYWNLYISADKAIYILIKGSLSFFLPCWKKNTDFSLIIPVWQFEYL